MSDKPTAQNSEEQRAARLTAYILDQLSDDERVDVEAELASIPSTRQVCEELTQITEELQAGKWDDSSSERSDALRTAVLDQLSESSQVVELPESRRGKAFSRRRLAAVITVSVALLLLTIPLHRVMISPQLANNLNDQISLAAQQASDVFVNSDALEGEQIELTKPEAEALAKLTNVPVEELRDGEFSVELLKRLQDQTVPNLVTYVEGVPLEKVSSREDLPTDLLQQIRKLNAANADLQVIQSESKNLRAEIRLAQQGRDVKFQAIVAGTDELAVEREKFDVAASSSGNVNADSVAPVVKPRHEMLAPNPGGVTHYNYSTPGGSHPRPQAPQGRAAQNHLEGNDGYWQLDFKEAKPAHGVQVTELSTQLGNEKLEQEQRQYYGHYFMTGSGWAYQPAQRPKGDSGVSRNEQYAPIVENQFAAATDKPVSTFSIDVDTASYANVRRFLTQKQLPPPNAVRLEELINYFTYEYPEPEGEEPFSVSMEVAECPWQPIHQIVRIGLKGRDVPRQERPASSLVFLMDVSGSMQDANKLPLLKQAMKLLTDQLTENDRVTIVTYAGDAGLALDTTNGENRETIRKSIDALNANGSTNGSAGIQLAYEKATEALIKDGANRVILATDGDLNVGVTEDGDLVKLITEKAQSGVFLTVLGFGEGNLKDGKLEKLADNGNGMYAYVDSLREARKVLIEQLSGSLVTIAKDVKIKVEFNPAEVAAYRLLGYENRLMTPAEFNDDKKDAGEIGAGHTVTALYEVVPKKASPKLTAAEGGLKYQRVPTPTEPPKELTDAAKTGELLTLSLRYKRPDEDESTLRESVVKSEQRAFDDASADFRFAAAVASFGMQLRNSKYRGSTSFSAIEETAASAIGKDPQGHRTEFVDLVRRASELVSKGGQ